MRIKSGIYVSAQLRAVSAAGGFGAVLHKGAEDAGAIYIVHVHSGTDLYGPAPQAVFEAEDTLERRFERLAISIDNEGLQAQMERQIRFDPDCWFVEIEIGSLPGQVLVIDTEGG